ncbi:MAG: tryptophan synthase subunit alpha [Candidatus Omnitrophica bacterium]|nr:tryptophan synthase subunit alpha [Candidatus Omnitrophota bacterium]
MNRINRKFKELKEKGHKAFIAYVAAGDPDLKTCKTVVTSLAKAGADIIELGIPFSDPLADGPTIQKATQRSLKAGCTVRKVMDMVRQLRREVDVPMVFMTYYNIVFNYGIRDFIKDAKTCGVDGVIVPDLPMEESGELTEHGDKEDFNVVLLAAPTTPLERFKKIAARSRGFIYYVSLTGVTGARKKLSAKVKTEINILKKMTKKPVCVGFGVSTPEQAKDLAGAADGVIVGSAIIKVIEKNLASKRRMVSGVEKFARSMARAVHGVK